jgi:transcriptional repressor NrdR
VRLSCAKRPVTVATIEALADEVEDALNALGRDDIASGEIGEQVMERLKAIDHVAYVRFASVYRDFQDIDEFYEEVRALQARRARAALNASQQELGLEVE